MGRPPRCAFFPSPLRKKPLRESEMAKEGTPCPPRIFFLHTLCSPLHFVGHVFPHLFDYFSVSAINRGIPLYVRPSSRLSALGCHQRPRSVISRSEGHVLPGCCLYLSPRLSFFFFVGFFPLTPKSSRWKSYGVATSPAHFPTFPLTSNTPG